MNLKVNTKNVDHPVDKDGTLYVLQLNVDGRDVVKIGVTCRSNASDRWLEILQSHFISYRRYPACYPKRFRVVKEVYKKETELLKFFKKEQYRTEKRFSGCTELVNVDLLDVVRVYDEIVAKGEISEDTKSWWKKRREEKTERTTGA